MAFGPLADQPLFTRLLLGPVFPALEDADTQEHELSGDGLPFGGITKGHGLQLLRRQAFDELVDRLGLRSGRSRTRARPVSPARPGTANTVSGANTLAILSIENTYWKPASSRSWRNWVFAPYASSPKTGARAISQPPARSIRSFPTLAWS